MFAALFQALLYVACFRGDDVFRSSPSAGQRREKAPRRRSEKNGADFRDDDRFVRRGRLDDPGRWERLLAVGNADGLRRCDPRVRAEFVRVCDRAAHVFGDAFLEKLRALVDRVAPKLSSSSSYMGVARFPGATKQHNVDALTPATTIASAEQPNGGAVDVGGENDDQGPLGGPSETAFFPFDPYILPRSRRYVTAYRHWSDVNDEDVDDEEHDEEEDDGDDESNDDDDDEGGSMQRFGGTDPGSHGLPSPHSLSLSPGPFETGRSDVDKGPLGASPHGVSPSVMWPPTEAALAAYGASLPRAGAGAGTATDRRGAFFLPHQTHGRSRLDSIGRADESW